MLRSPYGVSETRMTLAMRRYCMGCSCSLHLSTQRPGPCAGKFQLTPIGIQFTLCRCQNGYMQAPAWKCCSMAAVPSHSTMRHLLVLAHALLAPWLKKTGVMSEVIQNLICLCLGVTKRSVCRKLQISG
jgi:hypothetical protein